MKKTISLFYIFKMAIAIVLSVIAFTLNFQDIRGQPNLTNNGPVAQNNMNQGFPTNSGVKASSDFTLNSGNLATNMNAQLQPNIPQTLSSSLSMPSFFSLQPQQSMQQLLNPPQVTSFQHPSYQQLNSGQSFLQQSLMPSSSVIQQPNIQQASNAFVPSFSSYNYPQQLPLSSHLVNMPSSMISNPNSAIFSTYPSISNCGCSQGGFNHNSGNTYLGSISSIPLVSERPQVIKSYSTLPYTSVISSNPSSFTNNAFSYQNDALGFLNNQQIEDKLLLIDEEESLDSDNITALLLSLLQTPKKPSKASQYPYGPQGTKLSKSSHLKSLLPIILNLLKEKKERCNCDTFCKCKRKNKKSSEPQISSTGCSKKKEYGVLREEMFNNKSDEEIPRIVRDHKKYNKIRNTIPDETNESLENEDFYEDDK